MKLIYNLIFMSIFIFTSFTASAGCSLGGSFGNMLENPIALGVNNITVGPDTPDGTVVYRQDMTYQVSPPTISCTTSGAFTIKHEMIPMTGLASWSGSPFPNMLYKTGVTGLGAIITTPANSSIPTVENLACATGSTSTSCQLADTQMLTRVLKIIKIGPVSPGTISGSNIPCYSSSVGQSATSNWVVISQGCYFTGNINVVSQSCITPDVAVDLGTHTLAELSLTGATDWRDASIKLTNCPMFYGTQPDIANQVHWNTTTPAIGDLGSITRLQTAGNGLQLSLIPNTPALDTASQANGLMAVDSTSADGATGVAIQIALGTASVNVPFNLATPQIVTIPPGQSGSVSIPLVARYKMTGTGLRAGKANGKVTFTINYM